MRPRLWLENPETEVIIITGYANVSSAVEAMRTGVVEYLSKPFTDEEFKTAVEDALKEKREDSGKKHLKSDEAEKEKIIRKREVIRILKGVPESKAGIATKQTHHDTELIEERWMDTAEELARSYNFKNNLIEGSIDGILGCDSEGTIITFNLSLGKMLENKLNSF